jgi:hypothetical protein
LCGNDVGTAYLIAKLKTDGSEDIYVELSPCCIATEDGIILQPQILDYANKRSKKIKHIVRTVKQYTELKIHHLHSIAL